MNFASYKQYTTRCFPKPLLRFFENLLVPLSSSSSFSFSFLSLLFVLTFPRVSAMVDISRAGFMVKTVGIVIVLKRVP